MGAVITFRDITEYKRGEKERKKLEEQLFQAQKMESVGRLAGGVAHDFNNMLGVIIGHAEMALNRTFPLTNSSTTSRRSSKRASVQRTLPGNCWPLPANRPPLPRILDLNDTISGMLKMLRRLIGEDIDLLWVPEPDLWKVKMDPSQVDQILANLWSMPAMPFPEWAQSP